MRTIYAILDLKADDLFGNALFIARADAAATRIFTDALENPKSELSKHPEDYNLIDLGYLTISHELRSQLTTEAPFRTVATGAQWKAMADASTPAETTPPSLRVG